MKLEARGRSGHTPEAYGRDLAALGRWLGENLDIRRITPDALAHCLVSDHVFLSASGSPPSRSSSTAPSRSAAADRSWPSAWCRGGSRRTRPECGYS